MIARRSESPWDAFVKVYDCDLAGLFAVVVHRAHPLRLLGIRTIRGRDNNDLMTLFRSLKHPNLLLPQETFIWDGAFYLLHGDISTSLDHIITCDASLDEIQLATILAQILDGLIYLEQQHLVYPYLSPENILLTASGEVKIARLEECDKMEEGRIGQYTEPLRAITVELMQWYQEVDTRVGVDDVQQSPSGSDALDFLSSIDSQMSIQMLRKRPLFVNHHWEKGYLRGLVSYASRSVFAFCTYRNT
ncbi:hypothetical protein BGW36DRAFT_437558 [Talaromyces proteolyticus]|uniref:Protein kinase domain-containing protein n=1 Tax=Talaromyces proteolyticus TaxID=1131652 RepID=A0AAD4KII1_9EURO|nr:uncharacterized protein BGW36DRAFT_437558 [Talaromyces proteolyticus]KAH8691899.1 hypothetical protein BGW36DRAFT_437558 [Talaromyces proteolyticus]